MAGGGRGSEKSERSESSGESGGEGEDDAGDVADLLPPSQKPRTRRAQTTAQTAQARASAHSLARASAHSLPRDDAPARSGSDARLRQSKSWRRALRPLLPAAAGAGAEGGGEKPALVVELDDVLLHASFRAMPTADAVVELPFRRHWHPVFIRARPYAVVFLLEMARMYEIVLFTAALRPYADAAVAVLELLCARAPPTLLARLPPAPPPAVVPPTTPSPEGSSAGTSVRTPGGIDVSTPRSVYGEGGGGGSRPPLPPRAPSGGAGQKGADSVVIVARAPRSRSQHGLGAGSAATLQSAPTAASLAVPHTPHGSGGGAPPTSTSTPFSLATGSPAGSFRGGAAPFGDSAASVAMPAAAGAAAAPAAPVPVTVYPGMPLAEVPSRVFAPSLRLYRRHCTRVGPALLSKDVAALGRRPTRVVHLDASPAAFSSHPLNALPVLPFYDDGDDVELSLLTPVLRAAAAAPEVFGVLASFRQAAFPTFDAAVADPARYRQLTDAAVGQGMALTVV